MLICSCIASWSQDLDEARQNESSKYYCPDIQVRCFSFSSVPLTYYWLILDIFGCLIFWFSLFLELNYIHCIKSFLLCRQARFTWWTCFFLIGLALKIYKVLYLLIMIIYTVSPIIKTQENNISLFSIPCLIFLNLLSLVFHERDRMAKQSNKVDKQLLFSFFLRLYSICCATTYWRNSWLLVS